MVTFNPDTGVPDIAVQISEVEGWTIWSADLPSPHNKTVFYATKDGQRKVHDNLDALIRKVEILERQSREGTFNTLIPIGIQNLPDDFVYHFTDPRSIPSIRKRGLVPQVVRSGIGPKFPVIWFNREFDEIPDVTHLRVPVTRLSGSLSEIGLAVVYRDKIPPRDIEIFNRSLDDWEPLNG